MLVYVEGSILVIRGLLEIVACGPSSPMVRLSEPCDADKQLILGIVENSIGLEQFNKDVQDNLLKAMRGTVTALVAQAHARTRKQTSLKLRKSAEAKGKQQAVPEQVQLQF